MKSGMSARLAKSHALSLTASPSKLDVLARYVSHTARRLE